MASTTPSPIPSTPTPTSPTSKVTDDALLKMDTLTITDPTLLLRKLGLYLTAHDGLESNIGLTHDYWTCLSQYRMALNKS